jgi:hypothetical protein
VAEVGEVDYAAHSCFSSVPSGIVESFAALIISIFALYLTIRQIRLASGANHLPVVLDAFNASRSPQWFEAQEYILNKLPREHAAGCGWRDLPQQARDHVNTIGLFYDDLGKLVAHRMIRQNLVIGSYGEMIVHLWDVLAPYVYQERRAHMPHFWVYFEDLAARTAKTPPQAVYSQLRLHRRPPHREPDMANSVQELPEAPTLDHRSKAAARPRRTYGVTH